MGIGEAWKQIWKLPTPGVVRNFIWKLCSNILPTKDHLFRRHIVPKLNAVAYGLDMFCFNNSLARMFPTHPEAFIEGG